jgi:hypothetical protein
VSSPSLSTILRDRCPPLGAAQVRHLAINLHQSNTPVELLILRLVGIGLAPAVARQLLAPLRDPRERPRPQTAPTE